MPLLFAIAGVIALGLSFVVLVGPVLLVVYLIRSVHTARLSPTPEITTDGSAANSAVDNYAADAAFADIIGREWPSEACPLRRPTI